MESLLSRIVVLSRWLLVPLLLGLGLALVLAVYAFLLQLWRTAIRLHVINDVELVVQLLAMIDLTLIGALIVIVIFSCYANFVEQIQPPASSLWPSWMARISFSGLKLKLFGTMMAIGGITLLKALMKLETSVSEAQVRWLAVANVIFLAGYAVVAFTDHFTGQSGHGPDELSQKPRSDHGGAA